MSELVMASHTDTFGHVEAEPVVIELYGNGSIVKFLLDDGTSWVFEGGELRAALEPKREIREQAA